MTAHRGHLVLRSRETNRHGENDKPRKMLPKLQVVPLHLPPHRRTSLLTRRPCPRGPAMSHLLAVAPTEPLHPLHVVDLILAFNAHPRTEGTAQVKSRLRDGAQALGAGTWAAMTRLLMGLLLASCKASRNDQALEMHPQLMVRGP